MGNWAATVCRCPVQGRPPAIESNSNPFLNIFSEWKPSRVVSGHSQYLHESVNDTFGHPVGDELLQQVAGRLVRCVGDEGMVVRLGGDEFAILQRGGPQPHGANALALMVTEALNAPYELSGSQAVIGTSIGIAICPGDASSSDALLKCADMALYGAKADGRGTCRFFEPEMNARVKARRRLELGLRAAIAGKQFEMFYQPDRFGLQ
jgi:diguanylate cyclase (GGDEF)-like protein